MWSEAQVDVRSHGASRDAYDNDESEPKRPGRDGPTTLRVPHTMATPIRNRHAGVGGQGPTTRTPPRADYRETRNHTTGKTDTQTLRSFGEVAPPQGSAQDIDTQALRPHRRITLPQGSAHSRHHAPSRRQATGPHSLCLIGCRMLGPSAPCPACRALASRPARAIAGACSPCTTCARRSYPAVPAYRLAGFAPRQDRNCAAGLVPTTRLLHASSFVVRVRWTSWSHSRVPLLWID